MNYYYNYGYHIVTIGRAKKQNNAGRRVDHDGVDIVEVDGPRRQRGGELKCMTVPEVLLPGLPTCCFKTI